MSEMVRIVYSSDNKYSKLLAVSICSLFTNNQEVPIEVIIFDLGIDQDNKMRINKLADNTHHIYWKNIDVLLNKEWKKTAVWSIATYARFYIDQFPEHVRKVLYLDCDTVINGSIIELWETPLNNQVILGKREPKDFIAARSRELGIDFKDAYINAGILLINVDMYKKLSVREKIEAILNDKNIKLSFLDQDAINIVCKDYIDPNMDEKFNARYEKGHLSDNAILHYGGGGARANLRDFVNLYSKYIDLTDYKGTRELVSCKKTTRMKNRLWMILTAHYIPFGQQIYDIIMNVHAKLHVDR